MAARLPEVSSISTTNFLGIFTREVTACVIVGLVHRLKSNNQITRISMMHLAGGFSSNAVNENMNHLKKMNLVDFNSEKLEFYIFQTNNSTPSYRLNSNLEEIFSLMPNGSYSRKVHLLESKSTVAENGYCLSINEENAIIAGEFDSNSKILNTKKYFIPILNPQNHVRIFENTEDLNEYLGDYFFDKLMPSTNWIKKSKEFPKCMNCNIPFSLSSFNILIRARHHCRICGIIVCKNCIRVKKLTLNPSVYYLEREKNDNYKVCIKHY